MTKCNGTSSERKRTEHGTELLLLLQQTLQANTHAVVMVALTCLDCRVLAELNTLNIAF